MAESESPKISFITIVLNGMPFLEYSLRAVYREAHEIIVVEGAVENCMFAADADGGSTDGTVAFLEAFPDPDKKLKVLRGRWKEKVDMQNAALQHVTGDFVWLVDSDEIWKQKDLLKVKEILRNDPELMQVNFIPDNFWKGFDYIFLSPAFFQPQHHYRRVFRFVPGATFTSHRPPTMVHPGENRTTEQTKHLSGDITRKLQITFCHYSYVLESQVAQKIELYNRYGWGSNWGVNLKVWYKECFQQWNPFLRSVVEDKWGVWTGDPDSRTYKYIGTHPEVMTDFIRDFRRAQYKGEEPLWLERIGDPSRQMSVLNGWAPIELDEPLQKRREVMQENVRSGGRFWNIHTALAFLADVLEPDRYLEVGVRTGGSMSQVLAHSNVKQVDAVDMWAGVYAGMPNSLDYTKGQIEKLKQTFGKTFEIEYHQGDSHTILKQLIDKKRRYDLITIDGDHTKHGALEDMNDAAVLLNETGAIVFDDIIHPDHLDLMDVVFEFLELHPEFSVAMNTTQDNGCAVFFRNIEFMDLFRDKGPKVAADFEAAGISVSGESEFSKKIIQTIIPYRPKLLIETGTYLGTGTTTVIASALKEAGLNDAQFYTIEVNPNHYKQALANLSMRNLLPFVKPLLGLSVPREILPDLDTIRQQTVTDIADLDIFVDHRETERAELYYQETHAPGSADDLLGVILQEFSHRPQFILLDSGGHMGHIEFEYLISRLRGECVIALDDIRHVKHYRSFRMMESDPRFELLAASEEKFGFCLASFHP